MDQWEIVDSQEITPISDHESIDTEVDDDEHKANLILSEPPCILKPKSGIIRPIVKQTTWYAAKRILSSESFWIQTTILALNYASHVDWRFQAACTTIGFLMVVNKYRRIVIF